MATDLRPEPQDILMLRGSTCKDQPYAFTDANGQPLPTTGWTLAGSMNVLSAASAGAIAFTFANRDDALGTGTFTIPGFSALPVGSYSYYLRYTDGSGAIGYAGRGLIKISDEAP